MHLDDLILTARFKLWCEATGHKNSLNNYIWWKDNVHKQGK